MHSVPDRIAVISDIHGNRWALQAVLEDIAAKGITRVVSLGDNVYGPLDPSGTMKILMAHGIHSVAGNEDRVLTTGLGSESSAGHRRYVLDHLEPSHVQWLRQLPMTFAPRHDVCLCHASPIRNDTYLLYRVTREGVVARADRDILHLMGHSRVRMIVCGHSHTPATRTVKDVTIVDVGSVGLQAYTDESPHPHFMETGDPRARYAILTMGQDRCHASLYEIEYDWHSAAEAARSNGCMDWYRWLKTGRATG